MRRENLITFGLVRVLDPFALTHRGENRRQFENFGGRRVPILKSGRAISGNQKNDLFGSNFALFYCALACFSDAAFMDQLNLNLIGQSTASVGHSFKNSPFAHSLVTTFIDVLFLGVYSLFWLLLEKVVFSDPNALLLLL